jgi:DNA-binding response OmpR family regulator
MGAARILLIGRNQVQNASILTALKKRYEVVMVNNRAQAVDLATRERPHVIILDAVSMRTPGDRITRELRDMLDDVPIIHIRPGKMEKNSSSADVVLAQPFTSRKLINSVERLIKFTDDKVISCGPFSLNVPRRILIAQGQEHQLTPKLTRLVEIFLTNPGKTFDRQFLMEQVWDTNYMGDTRTLNVHIRWIRQFIEDDPDKPLRLITVRGVGYCFDLDSSYEIMTQEMVAELQH